MTVRAARRFATSGVGFLLASALAAWGISLGVESVGVMAAAESVRVALGIFSPLTVGSYIYIVRQLSTLRDIDELKGDERMRLREIIRKRNLAIWTWVFVVIMLAVAGAVAPLLVPVLGVWIVYLAWMSASWMFYSLFLIPVWNEEIASFQSLNADRKRQRETIDAALMAITINADKGWQKIDSLDDYILPPRHQEGEFDAETKDLDTHPAPHA